MTNSEFAEHFKKRTKLFSLAIIRYFQKLPKTDEARIIGRQLLKSATSTAANYRAVCRARSDAEFFAKLSIVVEEADETVFWLEILDEAEIVAPSEKMNSRILLKEASEILAVVASSRKTMRNS